MPILQRKIVAAQGTHQNFESPVLVEHHLGNILSGQHRDQKSDEYGFAGPGGAAYQRVAGIFAAAAIRIARDRSRAAKNGRASGRW